MSENKPLYITYERVADRKRLDFITRAVQDKISIGGKVLDVGCGNGIISLHLGQYGHDVTGIDVSNRTIEKANEINPFVNVKFKVQSAEDLVASGELFDVIICSEVLEHLQNPAALVKVLNRSLKTDGRLIVTVPNGFGPREVFITKPILSIRSRGNWLWKVILNAKKGLGYSGTTVQSAADNLDHIQFFSRRDLTRLSSDNNFRIIRYGKANFIEDVFPFSFIAKRFRVLQKIDCKIADWLPYACTGGFFTVWEKV
jgi:2-polyprenyl-3-methyl-5-hydroxy-6-metoxy-1,4-benzoquinol methylase